MDELPEKRNKRFADPAVGVKDDDRTVEMDRGTVDEGVPKATNDSTVHDTESSRNTEVYRNDYERALPSHYRLIRMIGRGGMSEVFLAEDDRLGRKVAIKFLNSEFRRDPDRMRRFNREARAASALNHPHILTIHDIGENEGVQFIVSEFIDGETLGSRIAKGKLAIPEAVGISIQIASALSASHNAAIVHRDIKPDNVMIRRDGSVKVLDFGLAKETGAIAFNSNGEEAQTLDNAPTSPGLILGTPQYMSPEQARGKPLDARTDIFSFGVILFEMVTGKQPFPGASMVDIIAAVIGNDPLPLNKFVDDPPELLVRIVEKALRKNKDERYGTMDHLLSDLRDLQKEVADEPFIDRSTLGEKVNDTRPNTIRTFLGESPLRRNLTVLFLLGIPIAGILAWWIYTGSSGTDSAVAAGSMRMVPIANFSSGTGELVTASAFSPDARMIAFASTRSGTQEIWVKPVEGGEPIQVTRNGYFNQYPVWSPNGNDIAFFSNRQGNSGIWRTSFAGGEQIQIASGISPVARLVNWTSQGKLYFQEGTELFAADEKTGEKTKVTDLGTADIKPRIIEVSDDGQKIAYCLNEGGVWKVKISDANGRNPTEVASSKDQIDQIAWEPTGRSVVYSSSANGVYQIFRAGVNGSEPVQLSNGNLDFFVEDVSGDGTKILYSSVQETSDLWQVSTSNLTQSAVANDVASEFWPDVSPDGKSVVYQAVNQADRPYRGSVRSVALAGSGGPLTLSTEGFAPVWSPDGRMAAFFRRSDAGISVWRVLSTGGDARKLADGPILPPGYLATPYLKTGTNHLSWSPDGQMLAYATLSGGVASEVWLVSADGEQRRAIAAAKDKDEQFYCPGWTKDGSRIIVGSELDPPGPPVRKVYRVSMFSVENGERSILFEADARLRFLGTGSGDEVLIAERADPAERAAVSKAARIVAINLTSQARRVAVTLENVYFENIHLSRDGRTLAYSARTNELSTLWTVAVAGGTPRKLLEEKDPKVMISGLAWTPDGSSIFFGKQTRTTLLSMLSN